MQKPNITFHHLFRGLLLFALAVYIVYLVRNDLLLYYIAPRMTVYVKLSAIALYVISVYQLFLGFKSLLGRKEAGCACQHIAASRWKHSVAYSLFLFPLLLGFLLPDYALGSVMADKKGVNFSSSSQIKAEIQYEKVLVQPEEKPKQPVNQEDLDAIFPHDIFTEYYAKFAKQLYTQEVIPIKEELFIETITTLDLYLDQFSGKKIKMSGFVYRHEQMSEDQFAVSRFAMSCCSADAAPYGILSEYAGAQKYADDTWVEVIGTLDKTKFNDMEIMKLNIESITIIDAPENTYVYPNYEFEP